MQKLANSNGPGMSQENSIGLQILTAIRRIIRRTSQHARVIGKNSGVSVPQILCLKAISEFPEDAEVTVALVAKQVQLSAPTVSRILDRMEKSGYICRERKSKDRRRVCVSLTEEGKHQVENLPISLHEQFLDRLDGLDPTERLELLHALERVVDLIDAKGIDAAPLLTHELEVSQNTSPQDDTNLS